MTYIRRSSIIKHSIPLGWLISLALLPFGLTGCKPAAIASTIDPALVRAIAQKTATAAILQTAAVTTWPFHQATETPDGKPAAPFPTVSYVLTSPQPGSDPLRFVFPTPGPKPISAWRPPPYDIPWAPGPYDHFYFARPIAADEVNWPVADYRYGGIFPGTDIIHTGVDIDAPLGTNVLAAGPGTIVWAGYGLYRGVYDTQDPYGLAVAIRHTFGYQHQRLFTVYAHMREIDVSIGQQVQTGDILGQVGITGKTTGPHLHFEVRVSDNDYFKTRNPELWLAPPQGWGVLVGRVMDTKGNLLENKDVVIRASNSDNLWQVRTYGPQAINNDPYYQENLVLSDLPAGDYKIWIEFSDSRYNLDIQINPGQVTYFAFNGKNMFHTEPPKIGLDAQFSTPVP